MPPRDPTATSHGALKEQVLTIQSRLESLIESEKLSKRRIEKLEKDLADTRRVVEDLEVYCSGLELDLAEQHAICEELWSRPGRRTGSDESSESSSESESSLYDKMEEAERKVKLAMRDRDLKRAVTLCFCRKMAIPKLQAKFLPAFVAPAPAEPADGDEARDLPLQYDWDQPDHEPVNVKAIEELTTYTLTYATVLHAASARALHTVKRDGIEALVTKRFKRLAKLYRDHQLVIEHDRQTDERLRQANERLNGTTREEAPPDPMDVDTVDSARARKVKRDAELSAYRSKIQASRKYASKYRNFLRQLLPADDKARKSEYNVAFRYQNQSPWVSDDDEGNKGGKKVITRKWETSAFQAIKRLEERTDINFADADPDDLRKWEKMKKPRRVPFPADGASDTDDIPDTRAVDHRVQTWMVDPEFLRHHPRANRRVHRALEPNNLQPQAQAQQQQQQGQAA